MRIRAMNSQRLISPSQGFASHFEGGGEKLPAVQAKLFFLQAPG
jgi:hypothetical protein